MSAEGWIADDDDKADRLMAAFERIAAAAFALQAVCGPAQDGFERSMAHDR